MTRGPHVTQTRRYMSMVLMHTMTGLDDDLVGLMPSDKGELCS